MSASMDNNGSIADGGDSAEGQEEEDLDDIISIQTELFEEKDADKDGQLDAKEFRAMLQEDVHPQERMGEQHVQEIFKHADLNGDKKVSLQEWMVNFFHGHPQLPAFRDGALADVDGSDAGARVVEKPAEDERMHARLEFEKLDKDADGFLNTGELLKLLLATSAHRPSDANNTAKGHEREWKESDEQDMHHLARQMVRDLDIDRDRLVSFSEFFGPQGIKDSLQGGADGGELFAT